MKRRCTWRDYSGRGVYMLTMVVKDRRRLLGRLAGGVESPHIVHSPLGEKVIECIENITHFYKEIEIWKYVCMEDHVHILLFVSCQLTGITLGNVVKGFKTGCNKALRALFPHDEGLLPLFEEGYHDRIVYRKGQLQAIKQYIDDNPRRLAIKRYYPQLFRKYLHIVIAGQDYAAYGNILLLREVEKVQVVVHRSDTIDDHNRNLSMWKDVIENGGVLVSPFVSPREKEAREMARDYGGKLIVLKENGFPEVFKPYGWEFDYCIQGKLLLLAPWPFHYEKKRITRDQCLSLNSMASAICSITSQEARVISGSR